MTSGKIKCYLNIKLFFDYVFFLEFPVYELFKNLRESIHSFMNNPKSSQNLIEVTNTLNKQLAEVESHKLINEGNLYKQIYE